MAARRRRDRLRTVVGVVVVVGFRQLAAVRLQLEVVVVVDVAAVDRPRGLRRRRRRLVPARLHSARRDRVSVQGRPDRRGPERFVRRGFGRPRRRRPVRDRPRRPRPRRPRPRGPRLRGPRRRRPPPRRPRWLRPRWLRLHRRRDALRARVPRGHQHRPRRYPRVDAAQPPRVLQRLFHGPQQIVDGVRYRQARGPEFRVRQIERPATPRLLSPLSHGVRPLKKQRAVGSGRSS